MLKGNKGEWSEVYALFKLLSDKRLHAGDAQLNKVSGLFYPLIKILREEANNSLEFSYESNLVIINSNNERVKIPLIEFKNKAEVLLAKLKEKTSTTFEAPEIESFLNSFHSASLKAKSSVKSDITLVIHDLATGMQPTLGFSIKSQLGNAATLLNAGKTTNFIYKITGNPLTSSQLEEINSIEGQAKIKKRLEKIRSLNNQLEFVATETTTFNNNLMLIDTGLPQIMASCVKEFFTSSYSSLPDLTKIISQANPLNFDASSNHPFYSYKIKRFLTDVALGMMPSKTWTGQLDATGGYLVVKNDGELVCYHIYNRNQFEDYLFYNTKLETASSSRHNFGSIYVENNQPYIKLNLQIRFIN